MSWRVAPPSCSRRAALAIAGAEALAGCAPDSGFWERDTPWYALLSDPHVAADPRAQLRGETMAENLRRAVRGILDGPSPPQGVIVNGDLALERGLPGDYASFLRICEPLIAERLPLHLVMGNHDDRANLQRAVQVPRASSPVWQKRVDTIDGPALRFVLLDSQHGVNVTSGELGTTQRLWLCEELDRHPEHPTVLMVHHHLDALARPALRDTAELVDLIRERRQVKMVIYGHTHVWDVRRVDGVIWMNLPALGYRFARKEPLGWVAIRPEPDGAEVELSCVGGDLSLDRTRTWLRWRTL